MATSSASESDSKDATYSDTSSSVLSLSYLTSSVGHEITDSLNGALEPYLYMNLLKVTVFPQVTILKIMIFRKIEVCCL